MTVTTTCSKRLGHHFSNFLCRKLGSNKESFMALAKFTCYYVYYIRGDDGDGHFFHVLYKSLLDMMDLCMNE